jgi:nucleoside-diphosphate-sugar epimerase
LHSGVTDLPVLTLDLGSTEQIEDVFAAARPTLVYHMAMGIPQGPDSPHDPFDGRWLSDAGNLTRLLEVARRFRPELKAFVRTGSLAEYGQASAPSREDDREHPATLYGTALVAASHYLAFVAPQLPFPVYTARLGLTYGPGQKDSFLAAALVSHCLAREPMHIREPSARRDMIHVDDVTRGLIKLARSELPPGSIVNLCSGVALTNRRMGEIACEVTGAPSSLLTFGPEQAAPSVVWGSTEKARALLGFVARIAFAEGIERTVRALTTRST